MKNAIIFDRQIDRYNNNNNNKKSLVCQLNRLFHGRQIDRQTDRQTDSVVEGNVDSCTVKTYQLFCVNFSVNRLDYLVRITKKTVDDFRRDRTQKTLSYNEEQIHKFEKSKLAVNGTKALSIFQGHCFPNTKRLYDRYQAWYR